MSVKQGRQFVDSNVLVYAHDRSAGKKRDRARRLVTELWESGDGCLSIQVCQEFFVNITRKVAKPLNRETAARIVADLGNWTLHTPTLNDVLEAVEIQERHEISFWDAMIVRSAVRLGCLRLWTEDFNHEQVYDGVQALNPF